jgi:hypothetical protein
MVTSTIDTEALHRNALVQTARWDHHVLPGLFRRTPGSYQRDNHTSVEYESLHGVKDPRGPVGMTATRKRGLRCSQPSLGGLTK